MADESHEDPAVDLLTVVGDAAQAIAQAEEQLAVYAGAGTAVRRLLERLRDQQDPVAQERDVLQGEVTALKQAIDEGRQLVETWQARVAEIRTMRDTAMQELETFREQDQEERQRLVHQKNTEVSVQTAATRRELADVQQSLVDAKAELKAFEASVVDARRDWEEEQAEMEQKTREAQELFDSLTRMREPRSS